ncbi:MAG: FAD-binding oxidoreductase [Gaiellales bacterium]
MPTPSPCAEPAVLRRSLERLLGGDAVRPASAADVRDATEAQGLAGSAAAVALPSSTDQAVALVAWCCEHRVGLVPRGGGTGFAGGAVPAAGQVVVSLERMAAVRSFDPLAWRVHVEAGMPTAALQRLVRGSGLRFPPDPGAAESSHIGGNIATNAGGPHAFKYGVTGAWVTGLEAVVPPGEVIRVGGAARKDVAGYDLLHLLIGSEGTLGLITAAWLRLIPAAEAGYPVAGAYPDVESGCRAIEHAMTSGIVPAAIEYLDAGTLAAAGRTAPWQLPDGAAFLVIAEADGSHAEALAGREELCEALADGALSVEAPRSPDAVERLWRWRDGVSIAVTARRGGKISEDVCVPVDALGEAIRETVDIGARHGLEACSWGHAGDGNLHSSFLFSRDDTAAADRARAAAGELFEMALRLGGTVTGEHGIGLVKRGQLRRQWTPRAVALHAEVKRAFDPLGIMNPGKKLA